MGIQLLLGGSLRARGRVLVDVRTSWVGGGRGFDSAAGDPFVPPGWVDVGPGRARSWCGVEGACRRLGAALGELYFGVVSRPVLASMTPRWVTASGGLRA